MKKLAWSKAAEHGVVTSEEADLLSECVGVDDDGTWFVELAGLDEVQQQALQRAVMWFTSTGGVQ